MGNRRTGVFEWAGHSENLYVGCMNDCRYCYARAMAVRFKRKTVCGWCEMELRGDRLDREKYPKRSGVIMFPTAHDIFPGEIAENCGRYIRLMVRGGNRVLVVTKARLEAVDYLTRFLSSVKERVHFRFTIGAMHDHVFDYWEPGASKYNERLSSLRLAYGRGYETSVSMEPLLEWDCLMGVVLDVLPSVTDTIWIGLMRSPAQRVVRVPGDYALYQGLMHDQRDEAVLQMYSNLKGIAKIRFKDSVMDVVSRGLV